MVTNRGLAELISRSSAPVSRTPKRLRDVPVTLAKERLIELESLLHLRDGFRTLGGSLLIRPSISVAGTRGVEDWNQLSLWRTPYRSASELLFFAEDVTGRQFAAYRDEIVSFDPEQGAFEHFAFRLEVWAERVLDDPDDVGMSLLEEWEATHPPLGRNERLQPRVPFMLSVDEETPPEFRVIQDIELMRRYARLYRETSGRPEGADVELSWWWEDPAGAEDPKPIP
jgi:hypothetical protein